MTATASYLLGMAKGGKIAIGIAPAIPATSANASIAGNAGYKYF